jgi:hypothetical protein
LGAHAAAPLANVPAGHVVAVYAQNPEQGMLYAPGGQLKHTAAVVLARVGL